jgi:pimeloyl-ACP methyl ester carboxylesterase
MSSAPATIDCQFAAVGGRHVLVRAAGRGAPLLLLHQSPQNSRAMLPWLERLAGRFAVFAPDTPGFGHSDPLPLANPDIPAYAAALAALLDALGLDEVVVFGVHTGAVTALRLALDFPERIAGLVCDGYARFNAEEREALLADYLPPFEPSWDGLHLAWAWARMREQSFYFPWHSGARAARLAYAAPGTAKLHGDVMDLLDAGDHYRQGYRAPLMYDDVTAAARLKVPARLFYRVEDVLASHLERLPPLPEPVKAGAVHGGAAALAAQCDAAFAEFARGLPAVEAPAVLQRAAVGNRRMASLGTQQLSAMRCRGKGATARLVIGDFARPARLPPDTDAFAETLAVELPGHGVGTGWNAADLAVEALADGMAALIGGEAIEVHACGVGAGLAARVAARLGARCRGLLLEDPLALDEAERRVFVERLPDATPIDGGGHLLSAWQWARLRHLYWPWKRPEAAAAIATAEPAPRRVHAETVELLRCGALAKPLAEHLLDAADEVAAPPCAFTLRASCATHAELAARLAARWNVPAKGGREWRKETP